MADTKISAMAASTNLNGDVFPVVESGTNKTGLIDSDGTLAGNSDAKIPTQKAVKTYADTKAGLSHGHAIGDVTNLQTALDGKASTSHNHDAYYADISHGHAISDVTGLQASSQGNMNITQNDPRQAIGQD